MLHFDLGFTVSTPAPGGDTPFKYSSRKSCMILSTGRPSKRVCVFFSFLLCFVLFCFLTQKWASYISWSVCTTKYALKQTSTAGLHASNMSLKCQHEILLYNAGLWHFGYSHTHRHYTTLHHCYMKLGTLAQTESMTQSLLEWWMISPPIGLSNGSKYLQLARL